MDRPIIQDIEQLHFLSSYYSDTMDELSKDLSNALDESSDRRTHESKTRRSKAWKCRSQIKSKNRFILGNSIPKSSPKSEDSDSSLDAWIHGQMDFSVNDSYHHTDSDDRDNNVNHVDYHLTSWRHCSPNLVESDSVNENHYPSKEPRRKRKFKRMTVDPPFVTDHNPSPSAVTFTQKNKRLRNLKSPKLPKISAKLSKITVSQLSSKMENFCMEFGNAATSSGKRKRCAHERSVECNGCGCKATVSSKDNSEFLKISSNPFHRLGRRNSKSQEINSSGLSSSESECGILTNDEDREADDEQSDFFQESGPACGMPNFSPWWENDCVISDDEDFSAVEFPKILTKSFCNITVKKPFVEPDEGKRLVRAGRRRLGNKITCGADEVFSYLPLSNEYSCFLSSGDNCLTKTMLNEKKKRKGMPSGHGNGEFSSAEANVDLHVSKKSSWIPAMELSRYGDGILPSSKVLTTGEKQELSLVNNGNNCVLSTTVPHGNPF
ncbi:G patch domain-containing protein 2-like [Argiope bruennichi]|uniref:G patch domain-containing protein 2 n=1 Tax=Argiope bruennichi TaxID=94029 RepID=A0A8T0F4D7_ARGBR|nr:G patch domain-containing protein 2-like [Argiope bruennichi]XP_055928301.1 G patch domain-containing protein 2-like [Argiope bruennichi]XP_055928302.1 G patch domain-containing protein 2-like [Argiope bruennichi]KAF8784270.1 G patch domain-containing protein 2 [Argiope bruennichi]